MSDALEHLPNLTRRMAETAERLLAALTPEQRQAATADFDVPEHREWRYLPGERPGLPLRDLDDEQQRLALELLDTGVSTDRAPTARAIIELDRIRRQLAGRDVPPGQHNFWVRILGDVSTERPWAWRMNGHHLAVHVTVVGDTLTVTPNFFGAEPATVLEGPHEGMRIMPDEEEFGRALLASLDPAQREVAVTSDVAPDDILTRTDPVVDPATVPSGLAYGDMTGDQRQLLERLLRCYLGRAPGTHAARCWQDAVEAGLEVVRFAWCGSDVRGEGHYYNLTGPTLLVEYDNTQDDANHIHSVWRDLRHDWGQDILAAHYAADHR